MKRRSSRLFSITTDKPLGYGLKIEAVDPARKRTEAALKVITLKQKCLEIAIRPVRVRGERGGLVSSSGQKDFNPESGKFSKRYGRQGTDSSLLMRDGGAGRRIPYSIVTDFNKG